MPYIGKSPSAGVRQRYQYTATAGQTTFSGTDLGNLTLTYTDNNFVDVFQNGVLLKGGTTDYTATSGTSVVLTTGASVSDVIEIIVYDVFSVGNFYNRTDSDSRYALTTGATMSGSLDLNGTELVLDADADTSITADTDDQIDIKIAGSDKLKIDASSHLVTTTAGTSNFVLGVNAGNSIASGGNYNVALGDEAGTAITTGDENVCIGYQAGDAITTGTQNVAIGSKAMTTEDENHYNVAIGREALQTLNGGDYNVAVGRTAGKSVTTGYANVLLGGNCGDALTTGFNNVAIGKDALGAEDTGRKNVAIGFSALKVANNDADNLNVCVGFEAGVAVSTGSENTFIGGSAGDTATSANRCTVVGHNCDVSASGAFDQNVLGNGVTCSGNNQTTIGASTDDTAFTNGGTSLSAPSDQRYKQDITSSTAGLGFINDLRPVTFKWKMKKDLPSDHRAYEEGSTTRVMKAKDELYHGFIAQEVKTVLDNHSEVKNYDEFWMENDDGRQRLAPAFLIPMLTKALQELSAKVDALETKNDALEARIKKLEDG